MHFVYRYIYYYFLLNRSIRKRYIIVWLFALRAARLFSLSLSLSNIHSNKCWFCLCFFAVVSILVLPDNMSFDCCCWCYFSGCPSSYSSCVQCWTLWFRFFHNFTISVHIFFFFMFLSWHHHCIQCSHSHSDSMDGKIYYICHRLNMFSFE